MAPRDQNYLCFVADDPDERGEGFLSRPPNELWGSPFIGFIVVLGALVVVLFLAYVLLYGGYALWFQANTRVGDPAETEAAAAEAIYQPIIEGAELDRELESRSFRSPRSNTPASVERRWVTNGLVTDVAGSYFDAATADGWELQGATCSADQMGSSLTDRDREDEDRGEATVEFWPTFINGEISYRMAVVVRIELTREEATAAVPYEPPTCLDDHVAALRANGPVRLIDGEEMVEWITPELLASSGLGEGLIVETVGGVSATVRGRDGQYVLLVGNAKLQQIAALWGREPGEVFSFTEDEQDYWFVPADGGTLILEPSGDVSGEAIRRLGVALRDR